MLLRAYCRGMGDPTNGIVWSLKRLFDPPAEVEREEREKKAHSQTPRKRGGARPDFRCRVCGYESLDDSYCPDCLADTMIRIATRTPDSQR